MKRYEPWPGDAPRTMADASMVESDVGQWVAFPDADRLRAELQAILDALYEDSRITEHGWATRIECAIDPRAALEGEDG